MNDALAVRILFTHRIHSVITTDIQVIIDFTHKKLTKANEEPFTSGPINSIGIK